jgi:broad specificity phosphatase PhoE
VELVCVRHGQTAWNAERRFQGHTDIPLDDEGRAQAQSLAVHLRDESFDIAVTSDLDRAATTAGLICAGRAIAVERDPELREMRFGAWEGLTWNEIVARWPELATAHETSPRTYTPEGGETYEELGARVMRALARITDRLAPDGRALVVSHAGVMHALVRGLLGAEAEASMRIRFLPASIMRAGGSPADGWRLRTINEVPIDRFAGGRPR